LNIQYLSKELNEKICSYPKARFLVNWSRIRKRFPFRASLIECNNSFEIIQIFHLRSIPSAGFNVGLLYYPVQQLKYFLLQMSKVRPYLSKQDWDPCVESSKPRMAIKERMPMMTICPVHKIIASSNNRGLRSCNISALLVKKKRSTTRETYP